MPQPACQILTQNRAAPQYLQLAWVAAVFRRNGGGCQADGGAGSVRRVKPQRCLRIQKTRLAEIDP